MNKCVIIRRMVNILSEEVRIPKVKQKPIRRLGEFAMSAHRRLVTRYSATLTCTGAASGRTTQKWRNAREESVTAPVVCYDDERESMLGLRKAACKAPQVGTEPSCWQRPRKRRSERCDKHLDHMTLTTRLPWHVSVDFCHARARMQFSGGALVWRLGLAARSAKTENWMRLLDYLEFSN